MDFTTLSIIVILIVVIVLVLPKVLRGGPKERTCPHCRSRMAFNARVCPHCGRSSHINFLDYGRQGSHAFGWFVVILLILMVLALTGIIKL